MNRLLFAIAMCSAVAVYAGEVKPAACNAAACPVAEAAKDKGALATPDVAKAKAESQKVRAERKAANAKRFAEMRAKRDAQIEEAAKKAGMTKEQYLADRKAKRSAMMAKRLGLTPEEFSKLTPDERRAKMRAMMRERAAKAAAAKAAAAEKSAAPASAPAPAAK